MKQLLGLSAAALTSIVLSTVGNAQTFINFQYQSNGTSAVGSKTAGADPSANWDLSHALPYVSSSQSSETSSNLLTSTGATSTVSETTLSAGGYDGSTASSFTSGSGDALLYKKFALGNYNNVPTVTLTLTGLTAGDSYELFTYVGGASSSVVDEGTVGGTSYYLKSASLGTYVQGTATTSSAAVSGNYFEFTGISVGSSTDSVAFSLTTPNANGSYTALYGFQLVDVGAAAAPEPSTYALLGGGILALVVLVRRKRTV